MSATINSRVQLKRDTTANWNNAIGFLPLAGELIVYTDYRTLTKEIDGEDVDIPVPGFKIGDGQTFVQDLPFTDEALRAELLEHINNVNVHVSLEDKLFWNNKINVNDQMELVNGALVFNRN